MLQEIFSAESNNDVLICAGLDVGLNAFNHHGQAAARGGHNFRTFGDGQGSEFGSICYNPRGFCVDGQIKAPGSIILAFKDEIFKHSVVIPADGDIGFGTVNDDAGLAWFYIAPVADIVVFDIHAGYGGAGNAALRD